MVQLVLAGALIYGACKLSEHFDKKELEKKAKEQEKIWNGGFCPECGRKWKYHTCRKESVLWAYVPDEVEPPYERI